jgi:hypothetical protein
MRVIITSGRKQTKGKVAVRGSAAVALAVVLVLAGCGTRTTPGAAPNTAPASAPQWDNLVHVAGAVRVPGKTTSSHAVPDTPCASLDGLGPGAAISMQSSTGQTLGQGTLAAGTFALDVSREPGAKPALTPCLFSFDLGVIDLGSGGTFTVNVEGRPSRVFARQDLGRTMTIAYPA